ncbi:MAG: phosphoribosyltransferase family protein [Bacteroidetes bacterium]|nr:phosphoribosyltransferase family protein [Bacteroidota bacterium]
MVVIPVLGSKETSASSKSKVSRLAQSIAVGAGAKFEIDCLSKNQHESLHLQKDVEARDEALKMANYHAKNLGHGFQNVLIVDDIVTRGATMSAVAEAIHHANPSVKIYGFALGRHQRREWLSVPFEKANAGIPSRIASIWDQA